MDLIVKSQDFLCLLIIPIALITINQVRINWKSLWDDQLTAADRSLLLRASFFILEPIVVFFHEVGHTLATFAFGGTISEFHYAILSGYVVPHGSFTPSQWLFISLAGNLVNIGVGYLCLLAALFFTAPPMVALCVYLGLWSIATSAVLYALLSIGGLYGDWIDIYSSPAHDLVALVAIFHAIVVLSLVYFFKGKKPRLWFTMKTRPRWAKAYTALVKEAQTSPNRKNQLSLAWLYYEASLNDFAEKILKKYTQTDSPDTEALYLQGAIALSKQKVDGAQTLFLKIVASPDATAEYKARAYMCLGQCKLFQGALNRENPKISDGRALDDYTRACQADPSLADAHFRRAQILNRLGRHREASEELQSLAAMKWLDQSLERQVPEEMRIAFAGAVSSQ
jgi:hypothetical protein